MHWFIQYKASITNSMLIWQINNKHNYSICHGYKITTNVYNLLWFLYINLLILLMCRTDMPMAKAACSSSRTLSHFTLLASINVERFGGSGSAWRIMLIYSWISTTAFGTEWPFGSHFKEKLMITNLCFCKAPLASAWTLNSFARSLLKPHHASIPEFTVILIPF